MPTTSEIKTIINDLAEINGISKHTFEVTCAREMGPHYVGELVPVTIRPVKSAPTTEVRVIIKVPINGTESAEIVRLMFQREIFAYTTLLPAYSDMEERAGITEALTSIKCYYHRSEPPEELLVLSDMRTYGYKEFSDDMFLDLDHVALVVREVGKLHAMSYALKITKPETFAEYVTHCNHLSKTNVGKRMAETVQKSMDLELGCMSDEANKRKLQDCVEIWSKTEERVGKVQVICHSDLWRSNFLFKYKEGKPSRACLLDYQQLQVNSPALDVLFLISACTRRDTRRPNYRSLLHLYHRTLTDTLDHFSIDADEVYPYEELERDLAAVAPTCLVKTLFGLLTWFGVGGLHDLDTVFEWGDERMDNASGAYRKVADDLITDYVEYGYI